MSFQYDQIAVLYCDYPNCQERFISHYPRFDVTLAREEAHSSGWHSQYQYLFYNRTENNWLDYCPNHFEEK